MSENMNDEVIEKINEADAEEIPPAPIAPEAEEPNFTEAEGGSETFAGSANSYASVDDSEKTAKILGIISLVAGIISLTCCCIVGFNIIVSIVAIVTGIISIKKGEIAKGLAIAGIACGVVGLVLGIGVCATAGLLSAAGGVIENLVNVEGL